MLRDSFRCVINRRFVGEQTNKLKIMSKTSEVIELHERLIGAINFDLNEIKKDSPVRMLFERRKQTAEFIERNNGSLNDRESLIFLFENDSKQIKKYYSL